MTARLRSYALLLFSFTVMIVMIAVAITSLYHATHPVLDWTGGNQLDMQTEKEVYHPGEMVRARMIFQKERPVTGTIKWYLKDHVYSKSYRERMAAAPVGIYDIMTEIERIPDDCPPGIFHFQGTINYPLNFLYSISYGLRTICFKVERRP